MNKKYITLIDQVIQGYHLSNTELEDVKRYLEGHLRSVNNILRERAILEQDDRF